MPTNRCELNGRREALGFTGLLTSAGFRALCDLLVACHLVDSNRRTDLFPQYRFDRIHNVKTRVGFDVAIEPGAFRVPAAGRVGQIPLLIEGTHDDVGKARADVVVEILDLETVDC